MIGWYVPIARSVLRIFNLLVNTDNSAEQQGNDTKNIKICTYVLGSGLVRGTLVFLECKENVKVLCFSLSIIGTAAACTLWVLFIIIIIISWRRSFLRAPASNCEQDRRARPHNPETRLNGSMTEKLPCFPRLDPLPMPAILFQYRLKYPGKVPSPLYSLTTRILNPDRLIWSTNWPISSSLPFGESPVSLVFLSLSRGREKAEGRSGQVKTREPRPRCSFLIFRLSISLPRPLRFLFPIDLIALISRPLSEDWATSCQAFFAALRKRVSLRSNDKWWRIGNNIQSLVPSPIDCLQRPPVHSNA